MGAPMNAAKRLRRYLCFLYVGLGISTVLIADENSVVVIDVGRQSTRSEFLREQGITHLNSICLSHEDTDHIDALIGILATRKAPTSRGNRKCYRHLQEWMQMRKQIGPLCNAC